MYYPNEKEFLKLTKQGNLIPVYKEIRADLDTPVSAFYKIADAAKYSFLLESVEGEEKIARYSFLSCDPELVLITKHKTAKLLRFKNRKLVHQLTEEIRETPLTFVRDILKQYKFVNMEGLPRFCGGMVGYIGYDAVRFFERLPQKTTDDLKLPDCVLV